MKYLVMAFGNEEKSSKLTPAQMTELGRKCMAYDAELKKTGRLVAGGSLEWSSTSLRLKAGKLQVTDGPFVDTKEVVGGFVIIEARDLNEAIQTASLHPAARMGEELGWGIELRPMGTCELQNYLDNPGPEQGVKAAS